MSRNIIELKGDLFKHAKNAGSSLGHCVSKDLKMGAGIAKLFREKYGNVDILKKQNKQIGEVAVLEKDDTFIYYLITKEKYWYKPTLETLEMSLVSMREHFIKNRTEKMKNEIYLPLLGCGLDKLSWSDVKVLLNKTFSDTDIQLYVCRL